ncbi:DUF922 domain-containing protein [uncultured Kriegella sp.]|mgnify:CR=1 FL=1|uniref:DUF922 domain-containing protein n=1 Tax=uncultured Kriegella sp. TaxID=1798910 RepID=UPI0030DB1922|tara:strand:+ start:43008 stop:43544 length:537 start_codon:yes stop_codon:yes gene_type:complete
MGTLRYILYLICIFSSGLVFSQKEEIIPWSSERKLAWSDFKGKPFKTAWAAATTASGISYEFSTAGTAAAPELTINVVTYFYPKKSWYRPELCDSIILGHEQLHFDISELYARKMQKRLSETRFTKNIKSEIKAIFRQINRELGQFQNRYDRETNFSRDLEKQRFWNKMIAEALVNGY